MRGKRFTAENAESAENSFVFLNLTLRSLRALRLCFSYEVIYHTDYASRIARGLGQKDRGNGKQQTREAGHIKHRAPTVVLCDVAANQVTQGYAYREAEHENGHGAGALVRFVQVADEGAGGGGARCFADAYSKAGGEEMPEGAGESGEKRQETP